MELESLKKEDVAKEEQDLIKDLLMKDYDYLQESLWKNEAVGETRVNFFIGIVTAVIGALGFLVSDKNALDENRTLGLMMFGLVGLLVLGTITLLRMIKRNKITDEFKASLDGVRDTYKQLLNASPSFRGYEPFRKSSARSIPLRKLGGLVHVVAALNALIVSGLCIVLLQVYGWKPVVVGSLVSFLVAFWAQQRYAKHAEGRYRDSLLRGNFTHAGGVVYRIREGQPEYLLIHASDNAELWVLPKGHIDAGESPETAAIRELREETGVKGKVIATLQSLCFLKKDERVLVQMYLFELDPKIKWVGEKGRGPQWFPYEDAKQRVSPDAVPLLELAHYYVTTA